MGEQSVPLALLSPQWCLSQMRLCLFQRPMYRSQSVPIIVSAGLLKRFFVWVCGWPGPSPSSGYNSRAASTS